MSKTTVRLEEQEGIDYLVRTADELLHHPEIVGVSPDAMSSSDNLRATWGFVWGYLQRHPSRPVPTSALAAKVSFAAQRAADLLDGLPTRLQRKWFKLQFTGSAMPSKTADLLRELVTRMKEFRR